LGREKIVKMLLASYHPIDLLAKCGYDHQTAAEIAKNEALI